MPGTLPTSAGPERIGYGTTDFQFGELHRPAGAARRGIAVIIHGGFWLSDYNYTLGSDLAADLARQGWIAWNLEYRRVGYTLGGWPATFQDIAAGIDILSTMGLDTSSVVAIGHSAGGQLAGWAGSRQMLPADAPGAAPAVRLTGVVSQAGVLDLTRADREQVGGTAVADLMGGSATDVADRYALADPNLLLPCPVPVRALHSRDDGNVPFDQSESYVAAATAAGGDAVLVETEGDHFQHINVKSTAWAAAVAALTELTA